jgi:hypothetical protein
MLALALLGLVPRASNADTSNPHLAKGIKLIQQLEYKKAERSLKKAHSWTRNTANDRALIHLHLGILKFNQRKEVAARSRFKQALAEDSNVKLPEMVSPKILSLFEQVRASLKPPKATPAPTPPPPTQDLAPPVDDDDDEEARPRSWYANWPAWTVLGVGVAAGVAGIALGVSSRSEKDIAEDTSIPYDVAMEHGDRSSSRALAANILFAAAGAAAITSGVLFYLGHGKQEQTTAAVVPTSGGLVVQLEIRR